MKSSIFKGKESSNVFRKSFASTDSVRATVLVGRDICTVTTIKLSIIISNIKLWIQYHLQKYGRLLAKSS